MTLYDKACWWERAIALAEQLKHVHETQKCDFIRVAEYLELQASFYRKVCGTALVATCFAVELQYLINADIVVIVIVIVAIVPRIITITIIVLCCCCWS
jgi:hypothetical protein